MSGRLIITTKKTYCPWNPANVERVLRDERLERERIERQQQREQRSTEGEETTQQQDGHINLFPEAREAEIRLAQKGGLIAANNNNNNNSDDADKKRHSGILPVPLGGEESINRKRGNVPFYLQTSSLSSKTTEDQHQYNNDVSYLGIRGHGARAAAATSSDEITNRIMRDQYASREDYRKRKNDPMSRFYVDDDDNDVKNDIYADREGRMSGASHDVQMKSVGHIHGEDRAGINNYYSMERHEQEDEQKKQTLSSRKRKHSQLQNEIKNDESSEISSSSESSSSSSCRDRERRRRHRKEHHDRRRKRSRQHSHHRRHRSESPSSHKKKKKKRHKHKKTKRKHNVDWNHKDDADNQRQRYKPSSSNNDQKEREEMRQRRYAREAREMERQRQL
jgi:hypothetical protein